MVTIVIVPAEQARDEVSNKPLVKGLQSSLEKSVTSYRSAQQEITRLQGIIADLFGKEDAARHLAETWKHRAKMHLERASGCKSAATYNPAPNIRSTYDRLAGQHASIATTYENAARELEGLLNR